MKQRKSTGLAVVATLVLGMLVIPPASFAQAPDPRLSPAVPQGGGFTSRPLLIAPVTGDDSKEFALIAVTLAPGASSPMHTHPGDCVGAVIEGDLDLVVDGQGGKSVKTGEGFHNARGLVHQFRNAGDKPVRLVTTIFYDKGQPRVQPLPAPQK